MSLSAPLENRGKPQLPHLSRMPNLHHPPDTSPQTEKNGKTDDCEWSGDDRSARNKGYRELVSAA